MIHPVSKYVFMIYKIMFDLVAMTILESCSKFLSFKIAIYTHRIAIGIYQLKLSTLNLFYFIIQFHPYFFFFRLYHKLSTQFQQLCLFIVIDCIDLYSILTYADKVSFRIEEINIKPDTSSMGWIIEYLFIEDLISARQKLIFHFDVFTKYPP